MPLLKINGGKELSGSVYISGSKNSCLAILISALLFDGRICINNVPDIIDIRKLFSIFSLLEIEYYFENNSVIINSRELNNTRVVSDDVKRFRASYYFMGLMLGRYHEVLINYPGGCRIGKRPIDFHLLGFELLGGKIEFLDDLIKITTNRLVGAEIALPKKSVGATINIILASCYAEGESIIHNASLEPEVCDVIEFLNTGGFNIKIIDDSIVIQGMKKVINKSFSYEVMFDRIEAGTFICLGLLCGDLVIYNANYKYLKNIIYPLIKANARIEIIEDRIYVYKSKLKELMIETGDYPLFPTDMLQIFMVLMAFSGGRAKETIYEDRISSAEMLKRMGANVIYDKTSALFKPDKLRGCHVIGNDLRGATSLLIAGLASLGETYITGYEYIERGYENIYEKIKAIGGDVVFVEE